MEDLLRTFMSAPCKKISSMCLLNFQLALPQTSYGTAQMSLLFIESHV